MNQMYQLETLWHTKWIFTVFRHNKTNWHINLKLMGQENDHYKRDI